MSTKFIVYKHLTYREEVRGVVSSTQLILAWGDAASICDSVPLFAA